MRGTSRNRLESFKILGRALGSNGRDGIEKAVCKLVFLESEGQLIGINIGEEVRLDGDLLEGLLCDWQSQKSVRLLGNGASRGEVEDPSRRCLSTAS